MRTGTLVAALVLSVSNASAASFSFVNFADSSGPFNDVGLPTLNNSGTVAFGAGLDMGGSGIFTGSGGSTTTIVDTSGPFADLRGYSLNNDGTVAFLAGNAGVFTGSGGPITTIFSGQGFSDFVISVSINDNGTVGLLAELEREGFFTGGVFTGRGGPLTPLYEDRESGSSFGFGNFVPINDSGTVAFLANLDPFGSVEGIVTGSGGPTTTIADNSGPFSFFYSSEENPTATYDLNDTGTVAFLVGLDAGGAGIFTGSGGPTTTIVDTSGPFAFFPLIAGGAYPTFSLNNSGIVAFTAALDTGQIGIFTGPDSLADEVISVGDPLFGSTVVDILTGAESLNDNGQIAFFYRLSDGRSGVALADPRAIPEPGTLSLFAAGLLGAALAGRRSRCGFHASRPLIPAHVGPAFHAMPGRG